MEIEKLELANNVWSGIRACTETISHVEWAIKEIKAAENLSTAVNLPWLLNKPSTLRIDKLVVIDMLEKHKEQVSAHLKDLHQEFSEL